MTQRTINLYDGLEALYYFDSDYFDGTTGEIKDKSGHGRHATANGGPTVGVNGPNDFEAANFDGIDDNFDSGEVADIAEGQARTIAGLVNYDTEGNNYWFADDSIQLRTNNFNSNPEVFLSTTDGGKSVNTSTAITDRWVWQIAHYDGSTFKSILKGEVRGTLDGLTARSPSQTIRVGDIGSSSLIGDVAFAGYWSRDLSWAELNYLQNLTAPRRAQL